MTELAVVILAAGKGTRMKSELPKVLHRLAGKPMVGHLLAALDGLAPAKTCVVVGHGAELVENYVKSVVPGAVCVAQGEQKGTGHAVQVCKEALAGFAGDVLVVYGDAPLVQGADLQLLVEAHREAGADVSVLTTRVDEPFGFGRVARDQRGALVKVVEEKEATPTEREIDEVNTGIYLVSHAILWDLLDDVQPSAVKGEYYLTDILEIAQRRGLAVQGVRSDGGWGLLGVNDKAQLALAEDGWQERERLRWLAEGVGMVDPASVWFSHDTELAAGVELEPYVVFGEGVVVGEGVEIKAFSHLAGCRVGAGCVVGPFARLRSGTELAEEVELGSFVVAKKAKIGRKTKAKQLNCIVDCTIGEGVNIGAGAMFANYHHFRKEKADIEVGDGASIGATATLVAPVKVGRKAFVAAGTVVREDVEDEALVVSKPELLVKPGYGKKP